MQFTTVMNKGKRLRYLFKVRKNWFTANRSNEKNVFQLLGSGKKLFLAISSLTNTVAAIWIEKKEISAIWRPKNVVHNCQEQGKRL